MSNRSLLALTLAALAAVGLPARAAQPLIDGSRPAALAAQTDDSIPSPIAAHQAVLAALRDNDVGALLASERVDALADAEQHWNEMRAKSAQAARGPQDGGAEDAAGPLVSEAFAEVWRKLLTDQGVEQLVGEWQPLIAAKAVERVGMAQIGLAAGIAKLAADPSMTPAERQQLVDLLRAGQSWLMRTDFSDPERLRTALRGLAAAVRLSGLKTPADVQQLEFDAAVARLDLLLEAGKKIAAAYDLDLDAVLRSASVREEKRDGRDATIEFTFTAFGVPVAARQQLRFVRTAWMPREAALAIERFEAENDSRRAAAGAARAN